MKIDKHAIVFRSGERRNDVGADTRGSGFLDLHGIKFARLGGVHLAPGIGARAAFGERLGWSHCLLVPRFEIERLQPLPRFRTDGRRYRNDARDMRGPVGIEGGGILLSRVGLGGEGGGECKHGRGDDAQSAEDHADSCSRCRAGFGW